MIIHSLTSAGSSYSDFGAYMKFGQPPGRKYTQYDLRPRWKYATEDSDLELSLEPETRGYQRGNVSLAVFAFFLFLRCDSNSHKAHNQ